MKSKQNSTNVDVESILTANDLYKCKDEIYFENEDQARGAFILANVQGLDGLGKSIHEWMGYSEEEYNEWSRNWKLPTLPPDFC